MARASNIKGFDENGDIVPRPKSDSVQRIMLEFAGKLRLCAESRHDSMPELQSWEADLIKRVTSRVAQYDPATDGDYEEWQHLQNKFNGRPASAVEGDDRWDLAASFTSWEGKHDAIAEASTPQDFDWVLTNFKVAS